MAEIKMELLIILECAADHGILLSIPITVWNGDEGSYIIYMLGRLKNSPSQGATTMWHTHTHTHQWISSHTWRLTSSNHARSMCWKGPWATRGAENTSCVAWRHKWNSTYITSVPTKQAWWHRCSSAYPLDSGSTHVKCWNCWSMPISQSFMFKSVEQHWNGCEFTQHHCHQQYKSLCRKFPSTFSFYPLLVLHLFS